MAITYTSNKNIQVPALNDVNWNVPLNANWVELDQLAGSSFPISIGTGTTVALTSATAAVSSVYWYSAQQLVVTATGNLLANAIITLPANITGTGTMGGSWIVINDITTAQAGIYTLTVKPASGTGVIIKPEKQAIIFYDGTTVEYADTNLLTQLDTIDGSLTVAGATTLNGTATLNGATSITSTATFSGATTFNSTANFTDKIGLNGSYGTSGQVLTSAGPSTDPTWTTVATTTSTTQASTSGTAVNFTGIPSGVKSIIVTFSGVSQAGSGTSSLFQIQIGSGSISTTGYAGVSSLIGASGVASSQYPGAGFYLFFSPASASNITNGSLIITNISGNIWVGSGTFGLENATLSTVTNGKNTLSGVLDRLRVTTVGGTDAFNAGSINITYA